MTKVVFIHPDGRREEQCAKPGDTLLDVALDNGVAGIIGQCGGGCTCCTCHCIVAKRWWPKLRPPHQDELDMLEYALERADTSRLACQVPALDGIEVHIPSVQS